MIRFILTLLVVILDFIFAIPYFLVAYIVGLFSKKGRDAMGQFIIKVYLGFVGFLSGSKVIYKGREYLQKEKPVLYVGNHLGFYDVIYTYPILPGNVGFIAKKEFGRIPLFAQVMSFTYSLFLDRNDIKQGMKIILQAIEYVKKDVSLFIFPEGTRSRTGEVGEFKEGSMKIATKSGCAIVPVAISNTNAVFEDQAPKIRASKVIIEFCEPIDTTVIDKDEIKHLGKTVRDIIAAKKAVNDEELRNMM